MEREENPQPEKEKKLSKKHRAFVDEYFKTGPNRFNATEAYRATYPKSSYAAARANSARLIAKDSIRLEMERRMVELHMSADEAMSRLTDIARGDVGELMDVYSTGFDLDMKKAKETGLTKLIKKVKQKTTTHIAKSESDEDREVTELEIELYPADAAIRDILKIHGRFVDRNINIDLSNLTTEQLERLSKGEDLYAVLANPGES